MESGIAWTDSRPFIFLFLLGLFLIAVLVRTRSLTLSLAPFLRAAALALLLLAMAGPHRVTKIPGRARPVLIDVSDSITPEMRNWIANLIAQKLRLRNDDPAILFGGRVVKTTIDSAQKGLMTSGCHACDSSHTDLEAALESISDRDIETGGPIILITDGWENKGDAMRAVGSLNLAKAQLYIFTPPPPSTIPNVAVTAVDVPSALPTIAPFVIGVTLLNSNHNNVSGRLDLLQDGRLLSSRRVELVPGFQRFDFVGQVKTSGLHSFRALFVPDDPSQDVYREDDAMDAWTGVGVQHKVLIMTESASSARYLATAVRQLGFEPEVVETSSSRAMGDLSAYDAVLLNNVSRADLAPALHQALVNYVRRGGSLAMIGGDRSFGLGGFIGSRIAEVLPVLMKPPEHKQPQRALVLVIDKSGSMGRNNKLEYAKAAALAAARSLRNNDLFEVIGFDSQPFVVVPLEPLQDTRPYLEQMIGRLRAQGTTYLLPALKQAYRDLASSNASAKHVVILTDGKTGGTAEMYYDLVSSMHHDGGVTISTIAIGREPNVDLLTAISRYGGGAFYQTDNPGSLPEITLRDVSRPSGELTMVEKEFRPFVVAGDPVLRSFAGRTLPEIKGFVSTELKPGARLDAFVERGGQREPIVASWRFGAGKAVAVTTDASGRWSADWVRQGVFTKFWQEILGWMAPPVEAAHPFSVTLGYEGGRLRLKLIDYSRDWQRALHQVRATVTRPDGKREQMPLSLDAAGEVKGEIDAPLPGTYRLTLRSSADQAGLSIPPIAYTVSPTVMAEIPRPYSNYALLERLATATSGRLNPNLTEIFISRPLEEQRVSLRGPFLVLAMILIVIEAFVRRVTT